MKSPPSVSIIIAFYKNESYLRECVTRCQKIDYPNFEIIVVGNVEPLIVGDKLRWLTIDNVSQGPKKDAGIAIATGEICAFIDDDAFPHRDWLKNAVKYFEDPTVGAVCGPGVAPPHETMMEKASSAIWASLLGSGPSRHRYVPTKMGFVDGEAPGYNLIVRRSLMKKIGGIASNVRSGEDAILSEKIRKAGKKIVYAPDVVVYHRRRPLFIPLLQQISVYGTHRGFFLRRYPPTSRQGDPLFALPLLHAVSLVIAFVIAFFGPPSLVFLAQVLLVVDLGGYLAASFISGILASRSVIVALLTMIAIPLVHFTYAFGYVRGLVAQELGERPAY